jgi:hypothetical protein
MSGCKFVILSKYCATIQSNIEKHLLKIRCHSSEVVNCATELDIQSTLTTATYDAHSSRINFPFYNLDLVERKFGAKLIFVYFMAPFREWCKVSKRFKP